MREEGGKGGADFEALSSFLLGFGLQGLSNIFSTQLQSLKKKCLLTEGAFEIFVMLKANAQRVCLLKFSFFFFF